MGLNAYKLVVIEDNLFLEFLVLFLNSNLLNRGFMHAYIAISWLTLHKVVLIYSILMLIIEVVFFLVVCFTLVVIFQAMILCMWVYIINFLGNHFALLIIVIKNAIIISPSVIMQIKFLLHN